MHAHARALQLNLGIADFFALSDGQRADGRGQCFYLQHRVIEQRTAAAGAPPTAMPTAGLGRQMREDITSGINRAFLDEMRAAAGMGSWLTTVVFLGTHAANGARTRCHFDQVDNLYLHMHFDHGHARDHAHALTRWTTCTCTCTFDHAHAL